MARRYVAALLLTAALAACSDDGPGSVPTTLPPTTRPPTPVEPTGLADTVRRWVQALEEGGSGEAAYAVLGPGTQAAVGGPEGYPRARTALRRTWGGWATTPGATFDGLPVDDGLAVVVVSAVDEEGTISADALPLRIRGDDWVVEPLLDTGQFRAQPEDGATVAPHPELRVEVDEDVRVTAFVDTQPAEVDEPDRAGAGAGRVVVTYRPSPGLRPGPHLVTLVFRRGEAVTARVVRYEVPFPD